MGKNKQKKIAFCLSVNSAEGCAWTNHERLKVAKQEVLRRKYHAQPNSEDLLIVFCA